MTAALFAAHHDGLRKRPTYAQLIDELDRDSLAEPDRRSKQLRETPQISGLLDGEGFRSMVELGHQQARAATHQAVEAHIRAAAGEPPAPGAPPPPSAQEMRVDPAYIEAVRRQFAPRRSEAGSQATQPSGDGSTQTYAMGRDAGSQATPLTVDGEAQTLGPQTAKPSARGTTQTSHPPSKTFTHGEAQTIPPAPKLIAHGSSQTTQVFDMAAADRMEQEQLGVEI